MITRRMFLGGIGATALLAGCSNSLPPARKAYPARGKVLLANGVPVRLATVHLDPKDRTKGNEAEGLIGDDGTFSIRTYSNREPDGAVPGEYKVWIEPYSKAKNGEKPKSAVPSAIPKKYQQGDTSELTVVIKPEENVLELKLT